MDEEGAAARQLQGKGLASGPLLSGQLLQTHSPEVGGEPRSLARRSVAFSLLCLLPSSELGSF